MCWTRSGGALGISKYGWCIGLRIVFVSKKCVRSVAGAARGEADGIVSLDSRYRACGGIFMLSCDRRGFREDRGCLVGLFERSTPPEPSDMRENILSSRGPEVTDLSVAVVWVEKESDRGLGT